MKVSIIFTACDTNQLLRQITCLSLQSIIKYTDEKDYELIFIDTIKDKEYHLDDSYHVLELGQRPDRQWVKQFTDYGQYECYNIGAKLAKGKYLCFFQNDVFVTEGWLPNLYYYLDEGMGVAVIPDQAARKREEILKFYKQTPQENIGGERNAGMIMMTREVFDKVGGWNGKILMHYGEKIMYQAIEGLGLTIVTTTASPILHIASATNWDKMIHNSELYNREHDISSEAMNAGR